MTCDLAPLPTSPPARSTGRRRSLSLRQGQWTHVAEPEARLILSDAGGYHAYNVPEVRVVFHGGGRKESPIEVVLKFYRSLTEDPKTGAAGDMDTCRPWSRCHCGWVQLSNLISRFGIGDRPFRVPIPDRLAIQLGRRIARTVERFGLLDEPDHCLRAVLALERLGLTVRRMYRRADEQIVDLSEVPDTGANRRASVQS